MQPLTQALQPTSHRFKWAVTISTGLLFGLAYTQSPLYTSNQNQYFLHGLARAGFGSLQSDWLANTRDPAPLFSLVVELLYRLTGQELVFYLWAALFLGVYAWAMLSLARQVFPTQEGSGPVGEMVFLAAFFTMHAAGLRFTLAQVLGYNWAYILEDGVADQRLLGPVLQPSMAGVFLPLSITLFLNNRKSWAILSAVTAALFHPTYLLSSATLTTAFMVSSLLSPDTTRGRLIGSGYPSRSFYWRQAAQLGILAILAVMPILIYSWDLFLGAPTQMTAQARTILVDYRIPHHAQVSQWFDTTAVVKIFLVGGVLVLLRRKPIRLLLLIPSLVAVTLTVIQVLSGNLALALLFPWRISTWLVPIASTILLRWLVLQITAHPRLHNPGLQRSVYAAGIMLITFTLLVGVTRMVLDFERRSSQPERSVEKFAATHTAPDQVYLTPVKMQDFRLESGVAVFVDFKSIPYLDQEVMEWYARVQLADRYYNEQDCAVLSDISERSPITHILQPVDQPLCPGFVQVYQDSQYAVYLRGVP